MGSGCLVLCKNIETDQLSISFWKRPRKMSRGACLNLSSESDQFYGISQYMFFILCEFKTLFVPVGLPIMFRLSSLASK